MDIPILARIVLFHIPEVGSIIRSYIKPHDDDTVPCTGPVSPTPEASPTHSLCSDEVEEVDDHVIFVTCFRGGGDVTPHGHTPRSP